MLIKDKCDTLPKDEQAGFMTKGWSKMKSHFGVTYRQIQQREFTEAVSLASRHAAEWKAADAVPARPMKNALQALPAPKPMDVATLCQLILGGIFTGRDFMELAYAVNQRQFCVAVENKAKSIGEEIAAKFKGLSDSDINTINQQASLEVWMRTSGQARALAA